MGKMSKPEYEARVRNLSEDEAERLLSRMIGKLSKPLHNDFVLRCQYDQL